MAVTFKTFYAKDKLSKDTASTILQFEEKLNATSYKVATKEPFFKHHNPYEHYQQEPLDANKQSAFLVAYANERPLGFCSYTLKDELLDHSLYIDELYVAKRYRGLGIGSNMLQQLDALAKENQCGCMALSALTQNQRAIKLYNQNGISEFASAVFVVDRNYLKAMGTVPKRYSVTKATSYLRSEYEALYLKDGTCYGGSTYMCSNTGAQAIKKAWLANNDLLIVTFGLSGHRYLVLGNLKRGYLHHVFENVDAYTLDQIAYAMCNKKTGLCYINAHDYQTCYKLQEQGYHEYMRCIYKPYIESLPEPAKQA